MYDHILGNLENVFVGAHPCKIVEKLAITKDWYMITGQLMDRVNGHNFEGDSKGAHETATVSRGDSEDANQPETHKDTQAVAGDPESKVRA